MCADCASWSTVLQYSTNPFSLQIEVQKELVRHGSQVDRCQLVFSLIRDPRRDQVLGKNITFQEESMVLLQRVQTLAQRARRALDFRGFLWLQFIQILVQRITRIDLVLDSVQARHAQRGKA